MIDEAHTKALCSHLFLIFHSRIRYFYHVVCNAGAYVFVHFQHFSVQKTTRNFSFASISRSLSLSLPHLLIHRILIFYLVEFVRRIFIIIIIIAIMYFIDVESPPVALLVHASGLRE